MKLKEGDKVFCVAIETSRGLTVDKIYVGKFKIINLNEYVDIINDKGENYYYHMHFFREPTKIELRKLKLKKIGI